MSKAAELVRIYAEYAADPVFARLSDGRRLVRGAGILDAPVMVIGEAPGREEALRGEPFVGPSGQLLKAMFEESGNPWEFCYRTNVVCWRPPNNRSPYPFEIANSRQRLIAEVGVIQPDVVVMAGTVAWDAFAPRGLGWMSEHRGRLIECDGMPYKLLGIYHPSHILQASGRERDQLREETVAALASILEGADA